METSANTHLEVQGIKQPLANLSRNIIQTNASETEASQQAQTQVAPEAVQTNIPSNEDDLTDIISQENFVNPLENGYCVEISFSKWGTSKKGDISKIEMEADKEFMRVGKKLLIGKEIKAIGTCDYELKKAVNMIALPSEFRNGMWLIAKKYVREMRDMLVKFKAEREILVERFIEAYPRLKEKAKEKLKDQYNERDYPSEQQLRFMFSMSWKFTEYGPPTTLAELDAEIAAEEAAKFEQEIFSARTEMVLLMRQEAAKIVSHLVERLTVEPGKKKKIFKESSIENINDFLKFFDMKNTITQDGGLAAAVAKMREAIAADGGSVIDAESLRTNDALRASIRNKLAEVGESLDSLVKEKTNTRRIAFFAEPVEQTN